MKKRFLLTYILLLSLLPLWAGDNFTAIFSSVDVEFNPHKTFTSTEAQLYTAVFEGLVSYHPKTLEPLPGAAETWTISDDGLTYTFTLRRNLRFSNGDPIKASDFRDSWLELMSPQGGSDYGSLLDIIENAPAYREGKASAAEVGIIAESNRKLVVKLEQRAPHLLKVLCHHSFAPVHKDFERFQGHDLIVNGPYKFDNIADDEIQFVKNEFYWDKDNVSVENLTIRFSDDALDNSWAYNRDEAEWITDSFDLSILNIDEAIVFNSLFSTTYLFFSNKAKLWENGNLRKALALLLPWQEIRSTQLMPGSSLIPSIPDYPKASGISESDVEAAMNILKEEGYEKGEGLPPIRLRLPSSESMITIGNMIKESWEENLRIPVEIVTESFPYYFNSLKGDDYTIGALTWIGDYADPMTFLEMWLENSSLNDASFSNGEYDDMIKRSTSAELEDRYKLMSEAETILLDSAQVMPLGHSPALNIIDLRYIDGWYPNVLDIHPFKYLKYKSGFKIPGAI